MENCYFCSTEDLDLDNTSKKLDKLKTLPYKKNSYIAILVVFFNV